MLYAYCAERGIGHQRCGKLLVATSEAQRAQFQGTIDKAAANGVNDLVLLTRAQAGEGVDAVPDWDMAAQAAPDYQVDQRITW